MNDYHDIYDRVAKRCLTLSNRAVIHFINGRFRTTYPIDSKITYNWTEHANDELNRTLADAIVTVNDAFSYQMEFQMSIDGNILLRVFEYSFYHAKKHQPDGDTLFFPEPVIIYLYESGNVPDIQTLTIRFGNQGIFEYKVPTLKYQKIPRDQWNEKELIILLPFQLLRLRKEIEKERTNENMKALKTLITHDMIEAIKSNEEAGNITTGDSRVLKSLTLKLYHHIYDSYQEMEEEGVNEVVEEALILDIDIIEHRHKKELEASKAEAEAKLEASKAEAEANKAEVEIGKKKVEALKLLLKGTTIEEAARITGLTEGEIEKLKNDDEP